MVKCKICKVDLKSIKSLSHHLVMKHQLHLIDYYKDFEKFETPKCASCGKDAKYYKGLKFRTTCGDKICIKINSGKRIQTEESKIRISNALHHKHINGEHPGWSFINNDTNRRSYPEKWFIKNVLEKHSLYSKYTIYEKLSVNKYFLDFAILDLMVDLEIDGQQHFRTENAILHDKIRDDFLIKNGWRVYRIAWMEMKENNTVIEDFLNWLENSKNYRKYNVKELLNEIQLKEMTNKRIYGNRQAYSIVRKEKTKEKYEFFVDFILNSDIDFSKFGWVNKVSKATGVKKVNKWMKRYLNDFYEDKCFKKTS